MSKKILYSSIFSVILLIILFVNKPLSAAPANNPKKVEKLKTKNTAYQI